MYKIESYRSYKLYELLSFFINRIYKYSYVHMRLMKFYKKYYIKYLSGIGFFKKNIHIDPGPI